MQKGSGVLSKTHTLANVKKDIARLKTLLSEKKAAGEQ
jgi:ribosomal protein L29